MSQYTDSIVAFLDILGFKQFVKNHGFDSVMQLLNSIYTEDYIQLALTRAVYKEKENDIDIPDVRYNKSLDNIAIKIMSDSIIVSSPQLYPETLAVIIDVCNAIQSRFYDWDEPIFLRGAIAEGDYYFDDTLLFGEALITAYIAQEKNAIYPRIIIPGSLVKNHVVSLDGKRVPIDDDGYYYIDTLNRYILDSVDNSELNNSKRYQDMKDVIEEKLSNYDDQRVRDKYLWLRTEMQRIEFEVKQDKGILDLSNSVRAYKYDL